MTGYTCTMEFATTITLKSTGRLSTFVSIAARLGMVCVFAWVFSGSVSASTLEVVDSKNSHCKSPVPSKNSVSKPYRDFPEATILSIRHKSIDVFDTDNPKENTWLYRQLNKIHISTRTSTALSQLLFNAGEKLDVELVAESERILRSREYLSDARIRVDEVCPGGVALLVVTRDVWTTEPETKLSREGGENEHGFGLKEGNLAGTGTILQIGYYKDSTRSQIDYGIHSPHIFNSRWVMDVHFAETSDGQEGLLNVERPFYSLGTPWSVGGTLSDNSRQEFIRYRDEDINEYKHEFDYRELYAGYNIWPKKKRVQRVSLGLSYDDHRFSESDSTLAGMPEDYRLNYPWIEYRLIEKIFGVYTNLNYMHQTEDVSLGADLRLRLGYAGANFDNNKDLFIYELDYSDLLGVGPHHLLTIDVNANGWYNPSGEGLQQSLWGAKLGYHYLMGSKHRWYSSVSYNKGHQLLQHNELTAGGVTGLRGYPLDYQRGDQSYILTLEKRYISDLHLFNLVRIGVVTYLDFGKAWGRDYDYARQLADVGIGLRFSSSKARVGTLLHIDLAAPLVNKNEVDSYQLILKGARSL